MYLLGYDLGSSSVKASIVHAENGECLATDFFPKKEMEIISLKSGWADQNPELCREYLTATTHSV